MKDSFDWDEPDAVDFLEEMRREAIYSEIK